jgi:peptidyl-prolyl cis-trans isomerase C
LDENTEGGDLGYFTKAMMIPEFGDAVFDMKKGQLSSPIKTPFGWHVVLVEDKRLANPPSFDEVRDDIERAVMETKLQQVLDEERAKLNVQILRPTM